MIRKDVFVASGGFSNRYGIGLEDYDFLLKLGLSEDIDFVVLPEPYLHFRLHDEKIRNSHIDWRRPRRLQAAQWRLFENMGSGRYPALALAYARQLHEVSHFQYIASPRPRFFRLRSVFLHQYLRPFLSRRRALRHNVRRFTSSESRLSRFFERLLFR